MRLHEFLESTYVSNNIELQQNYSPFKQARTNAVQDIINGQKRIFRFVNYFLLFFRYFGVKLGMIKEPLLAMEIARIAHEKAKAEHEAALEEKKLKSVPQPQTEEAVITPS